MTSCSRGYIHRAMPPKSNRDTYEFMRYLVHVIENHIFERLDPDVQKAVRSEAESEQLEEQREHIIHGAARRLERAIKTTVYRTAKSAIDAPKKTTPEA